MPHLKIAPFDTSLIEQKMYGDAMFLFHAVALNEKEEMLGIRYKNEEFLLQLKPGEKSYLLKYDKVTRPLKVNLLKEALHEVSVRLGADVLSSNITIHHKKPPLSSRYFKKIDEFENIVYPKEKISVEVGFGSGRHLLYQAKKHPDTLFIGIEIHTPSAQQVLKQIELQDLHNIWVVNYDARLFLEMLPSNVCEQIFVHFPVPWDKKPHRRVIGKGFLDESMRVLRKGGRLELRTDSDTYFWYALETFFSVPQTKVEVQKNQLLEVTSKYEARWRKQEKDIYDVYVTCMQQSESKMHQIDFDFHGIKYVQGLEERLATDAIVFEDYFVHFERICKVGNEGLLIRCAFGSFDRPEHKYLLLDTKGCRYFASSPVKTTVNFNAHQKIAEYLNHV